MLNESIVERENFSDGCHVRISGAGGGKRGSGKGSKNSRASSPTEAGVSLRSRAYVTMLAVIGEGEIASFPKDPLECIYLDETPIKSQDGTINFKDVILDHRNGTQHQSYIPLTNGIEAEQDVSVKVTASNGPITRTLTNPNANVVKVRLMVPLLRRVDSKNNIVGTSVNFRIDLSTQGGPYRAVVENEIEGYTTGPYERSYSIPLSTNGPWDIRLTRLTKDSDTTTLSNELYFQALTAVVLDKFRYPNTALLAMRISAEQFKSIPKLSIDLNLLKIRLPHNYNPATRAYSGIFNGSLTNYGFSSNPAWIYYDLLTNPRYGLGELIDVGGVDIFSLYSIGQYCDELVPDGRGGLEPRFECHCYIQSQDDAFKVIDALASVFRGIAYYAAGTITLVQDRPRLPVRLYTEANVVQEVDDSGRVTSPPFTYSGVAKSAIHTVAQVAYSNKDNFYKQDIEVIDDPESRRRYGFNPTEITAFGCVSRSQARRVGEWLLTTERLRTETITFKVGSEGLQVRPGEVFRVADPMRQRSRRGGRVVASTTNSITIDAAVFIEGGGRATELYLVDANGAAVQRTLSNVPGPATVLTFSQIISPAPPVNTVWVVESFSLVSQLFQCAKVVEQDLHVYEITGTTYVDGIYDYVDRDQPIPIRNLSTLPDPRQPPPPPGAPQVTETLYATIGSSGVKSRLDINWDRSSNPYVDRYRLRIKLNYDSSYSTVVDVSEPRYTLNDVSPGIYDVQVSAISRLGVESLPATTRFEARGLTAPPADVTNFAVSPVGDTAFLSWDLHPDLDMRVGGRFCIKHTRKLVNATWADGMDLALVAGNATSVAVPLLDGTYTIKAVDSSGIQSFNLKSVVVQNLQDAIQRNVVLENCEHPGFSGTKQNVISTGSALKLASLDMLDFANGSWDAHPGRVDEAGNYFDSIAGRFDDITGLFDSQGTAYAIATSGAYDLKSIDLGEALTCRVTADMEALKINEYELFDGAGSTFDQTLGLFDGEDIDSSSAILLISVSQDGETYTDYQRFLVGDYIGRAFKFRLLLESGSSYHNIQVNKLCIIVDMPDRIEVGDSITSAEEITLIDFGVPFYDVPSVGISIQDGGSGDYVQIGDITSSGFALAVKNSANINIPRRISWYAKGFGKRSPLT